MDNKKDDKYYALKAVEEIEIIKNYLGSKTYDEFLLEIKNIDAIMFRLIQLVENIKNISLEFKNNHQEIEWGKIVGFRNGIVHEYGKTDYSIVYEIITLNLDSLKQVLLLIK